MEYYEVAASWWKKQVCNLNECRFNERYKEGVEGFEKSLAKSIMDNVNEHGFMFITADNYSKELFEKLSKIQRINIKDIPEEIAMFIRPYNVTVVTGGLGNINIIYQREQQT